MPRKLLDDEDPQDRKKVDEDREPVSWRDKDRRKDRSFHSSPDPRDRPAPSNPHNRFVQEQERKGNLATANALFANPAKEALERKILAASSDGLEALTQEYVDKYGFPTTFELLAKLTEHPSPEVAKQALEALEPLYDAQPEPRRKALLQSLKLLGMMGRDPAMRRAASSFVRRHSS